MQDKIKCFSVDPGHLSLTHNSSTAKKRWLLDGLGQLVTTLGKILIVEVCLALGQEYDHMQNTVAFSLHSLPAGLPVKIL